MHLLWLAVCVGVVAGLPTSTLRSEQLIQILSEPYRPNRNEAFENLLLGVIEDLRKTMLTGTDSIPVLDPLEIKSIELDDGILPFPGAKVAVTDLVVSKLSTFVINDLSVTRTSLLLQRYRVILDGDIPTIDVDVGGYDMSVNALGMHVFGKGDAKIYIVRPRISANVLVAPRISINGIFLNLLECDIKFSLADFEPHVTGMFNDPGASDFVSLFIKNMVSEALENYEDDINQFLSSTVHEAANDFLNDFNLIGILG